MNSSVKQMLDFMLSRTYRSERSSAPDITELPENISKAELAAILFEETLLAQKPRIFDGDIFGFNRTTKNTAQHDGKEIFREGNITPNYGRVISRGFDAVLSDIASKKSVARGETLEFYSCLERHINSILNLCERYRVFAEENGHHSLCDALANIPRKGATSLFEACLFQKILIFALRCARHQHVTLGRFDQYMYPFYKMDIEKGKSREEILETVELYFISLNFDTDIYCGIQQGDNGQSMVLGGYDLNGNDMYNELSEICMEASEELNIIDPKINLRVSSKTSIERFERATRLTKKGLGFPQYCNDDVVVPGLIALGYEPQDAVNYTVAACWEFIVPNCSFDIPNIATMNFPRIVGEGIREGLKSSKTFAELMTHVKSAIEGEVDAITDYNYKAHFEFSPMMSLLVDGCIEKGADISLGAAKYNCMGCHGAGISNAADALAAVKRHIYDEKSLSAEELLEALDADFEGYNELRNRLLSCPKMGNNDDYVDDLANEIMDIFSKSLNLRPTRLGGFWRAGTGSAMEYILSARNCPATADGKRAGDPFGSSFSPAITTKLSGPLSVIQSFTKYDMKNIINGGPLTMELHDTVFRNIEGEKKVAQLVKLFVDLGGHQLQLNSINRDRLLDAQQHPHEHPNLIVRVWGWSGYFCELDKDYQNHIIARTEFSV